MFKKWDTGNLVEDDSYDGSTEYNTIEAFETDDKVNKHDLNRPVRNLYELTKDNFNFNELLPRSATMTKGVLKGSNIPQFNFIGDTDVLSVTYNPQGGGDTTQYYARLRPGIAVLNETVVVSTPNVHIAERQLEEIFSLETWAKEDVEIKYYYSTDTYQARIKRKNTNGVVTNYDFLNGGTWGDSAIGYNTAVELIAGIAGDSLHFRDELFNAIGSHLQKINLEPTIALAGGDSYFWYVESTNGNIIGDSADGGAADLKLYGFTTDGDGDSYTVLSDRRQFLQNYNDLGQYVYLNVPQDWGDTDTTDISNPYQDTSVDYSKVTNQNTLLVFLRKSSGDTYDSSIFGWYEDNVPDIDSTRSDVFFSNRDIVAHVDLSGDTLGSSWVSIKELSGDSWTFYGDKRFLNGYLHQDGTSAEFILGDSFSIDTQKNVDIDVDGGFTVDENSGALFHINQNGAISLTTASNQDFVATTQGSGNIELTAAGDSIIFTANSIINNVTEIVNSFTTYSFSGDSISYTLTGTDDDSFKVDTAGGIDLDVDNGFTLNENSGGSFSIDTSGAVTIDSASNQGIILNAPGTGDVTIKGDSVGFSASSAKATINTNGRIDIDAAAGQFVDIVSDTEVQIDGGATLDLDGTTTTIDGNTIDITGSTSVSMNGSGASLALDTNGKIDIDAATGQLVDIASDQEVQIGTAIIDINGTTVTVDGTTIDLTGATSVNMNANGASLAINSSGRVDIDAQTGQLVDIDSDTEVQIDGGALVDINGTTVTIDGTNIDLTGTVNLNGTETQVDATTFDVNSTTQTYNGSTITMTGTSTGTGIDLNATGSGGDITITANDQVDIDGDDIFLDASGGHIGITGAGRVDIDAQTGQLVDITSDTEVQINGGALVDIDGTSITMNGSMDLNGNIDADGTTASFVMTGTGTDAIRLYANGGGIDVDATKAIHFATSGATFQLTDAGAISAVTGSGDNLTLTATSAIVDINGSTLRADVTTVDLNGNVDVSGNIDVGDNANARLYYDADCSAEVPAGSETAGLACRGAFVAKKVYNAVWNDYAEGFEFSKNEKTLEPGKVYKQTEDGLVLTNKHAEKGTIGVYSDSAAMLIGSKDCITDPKEIEGKTKLPIALAGRVMVYVHGKIEIGDELVSDKKGYAVKATLFDKVFHRDRIIGKALENKDKQIRRIEVMV